MDDITLSRMIESFAGQAIELMESRKISAAEAVNELPIPIEQKQNVLFAIAMAQSFEKETRQTMIENILSKPITAEVLKTAEEHGILYKELEEYAISKGDIDKANEVIKAYGELSKERKEEAFKKGFMTEPLYRQFGITGFDIPNFFLEPLRTVTRDIFGNIIE